MKGVELRDRALRVEAERVECRFERGRQCFALCWRAAWPARREKHAIARDLGEQPPERRFANHDLALQYRVVERRDHAQRDWTRGVGVDRDDVADPRVQYVLQRCLIDDGWDLVVVERRVEEHPGIGGARAGAGPYARETESPFIGEPLWHTQEPRTLWLIQVQTTRIISRPEPEAEDLQTLERRFAGGEASGVTAGGRLQVVHDRNRRLANHGEAARTRLR